MPLRRRPTWADLALTAALVIVGLFGTSGAAQNQHTTVPTFAYVLAVAACLPILGWRHWPLWTFVATSGVTVLYLALRYPYGPILITLAVMIVGTALRLPVRRTLVAMGALAVAMETVIGLDVLRGTRDTVELLTAAAWLVVPAAVAVAVRVRRDAAIEVRAEQARRAVSEERLRLSREVHDVAGHGFAVIAMQAGVALRVLDRDPAAARAALEGIRSASREALDSLRAEIDALQEGGAPLRPTPGLAELPALVARIRTSGLPVTLETRRGPDEEDDPLPAEVDQAAYRIIQEALTNVLRHAGATATASVAVWREPAALRLEVSNTGTSASIVDGGRGVDGMRARAESLGGSLDADPTPEGFRVTAHLPVGSGGS